MTLLQALAKSEELNCDIISRSGGLKTNHSKVMRAGYGSDHEFCNLPDDGWELDDTPMPVSFVTEILKVCVYADIYETGKQTEYIFKGDVFSNMPSGIKVKVTLEPIS